MITDTEDRNSDNEYIMMPPLIYTVESDEDKYYPPLGQPQSPREAPSKITSMEPTSETRPPSEKPAVELTS